MSKLADNPFYAEDSRRMGRPTIDRSLEPRWNKSLGCLLAEYEIALVDTALTQAGGNIAKAARISKTIETTLREKMKKYGLKKSDYTSF